MNHTPLSPEDYFAMLNASREMMLFGRVERDVVFRALYVNRSYVETVRAAGFDVTADDIQGHTLAEILRRLRLEGERAEEIHRRFEQVIAQCAPVSYGETTPTPRGNFYGRTTITPILDAEGRCTYVLYSSQDITEEIRAVRSLRDSEEKFAKAFRASPMALTISDFATGRYIDVNLGFERMSGFSSDEVIGRSSVDLGFWRNEAERDDLVRRVLRDGSARDLEITFINRSGRSIMTRCACERLELGGRACLLSVLEDVTERRETERQRTLLEAQLRQAQKLEALGTLAGGIAHDFNNILTAIMANQELAVMDINNPLEVRERLHDIGRASLRAKELVGQILAFSRRQEPRVRVEQPLGPVIEEAMALVRASVPALVEIETLVSRECPVVLADATQLHQIVLNLCANAAYAMRGRPGRLSIKLDPVAFTPDDCLRLPELCPGRHVRLTIADNGEGMTDSVLARIFEPFFTTKGPGEGTGLGLAVVHGIVRDHRGAIRVRSKPGEGTIFELFFPAVVPALIKSANVPELIAHGQGERVLVVDDEDAICRGLQGLLRRLGYQVTSLADPIDAAEQFEASPHDYDLILADMTMPRLTGPELIARLRRTRPRLPAILMSGARSAWTGSAHHPFEFIDKPLDIPELSHALRRALAR